MAAVDLAWDEPARRGGRYSPRAVRRLASLSEERVTDDSSDTLVPRRPFRYRMRDDDYGEESEYSSGSSSEVSSARPRKSGSSGVLGWSGSPAPGSVFAVVSTAVVLLCSGALLYLYVNWSNDRMGQQQLAAATKRAPAAAASGASAVPSSSPAAENATTEAASKQDSESSTEIPSQPEQRQQKEQPSPLHSVCLTRFCLAHSSYLEGFLDWAADPCADFYAFACSRRRRASDALLVARTERALLEALRARPPPLLGLCWKGATRTGLRQLRELLEDVGLAGWPYRNNRDHVDAWRVAATLTRDLGLDALLAVELLQTGNGQTLVTLGEPDLLIGQHRGRRLPRWYTDGAAAAFRLVGGSGEPNASAGVRDFSEKLAEISSSRGEDDFAASRFRVTTAASYAAYKPLLSLVLRGLVTVHDQTKLLVKSDRYLRALRSVLQMTRASEVLNYLGFRLMVHVSPLLQGEELRDLWQLHLKGAMAPTTGWPRWKRCLRLLEPLLQETYMSALAPLLDPRLASLSALAAELKGRMVASLPSLPWMSASDRARARNVLSAVRVRFSYTPYAASPAQRHHQRAPVARLLPAYRDACRSSLAARLGGRWKGSVFDTWPRWDWASGSVFVPAALLDLGQPADQQSLGVPRIASRLARSLLQAVHQRSHALGRVEWSLNTSTALHRLQGCLDAQRGGPEPDGLSSLRHWLDSASLAPAQAQFSAYLRESRVAMGDTLRRGLTARQLFHVLLATSLCDGREPEAQERVNQPLRNSQEFATLWNCSLGSPMNPNRRCTLWSVAQQQQQK
ncbi:endothelin-converting enzyme 1-like [Rhipicephalus microplus]|uniref:endothelin-converting enzyme 1-like n=1 Tax=Rhipicephalus microplus TaxID=6941 RepID=UPI003F6A55F9